MKVAFRCDASIAIGTGHVMRCMTLARALRDAGAECHFISRAHRGHLGEWIRDEGFGLSLLPASQGPIPVAPPVHAPWAAVPWTSDADDTRAALVEMADWLVVDHYAFDARWHDAVRPSSSKLMVIDDLADRPLSCDLLLDQNFGRSTADYDHLLPDDCTCLIGPQFALLRREFAHLRTASIARRLAGGFSRMLLSMGGMDSGNNVGDVLDALCRIGLPAGMQVKIVMGSRAPYLAKVRARLQDLPFSAELLVDVGDMAQLMLDCDLAISASGLIVYELACMGVPMLLLPVSDIQRHVARQVSCIAEAHVVEDWQDDSVPKIVAEVRVWLDDLLARMPCERRIADVLDGQGLQRVVSSLTSWGNTDGCGRSCRALG